MIRVLPLPRTTLRKNLADPAEASHKRTYTCIWLYQVSECSLLRYESEISCNTNKESTMTHSNWDSLLTPFGNQDGTAILMD